MGDRKVTTKDESRAVAAPGVARYDGAMNPEIKHVRYADFIKLASEGVTGLDGFREAVDALCSAMGGVRAHHVLFDLRHAVTGPIPEPVLIEALELMRRRGLGVDNRVALVTHQADLVRSRRSAAAQRIAVHLGMRLRAFTDYAEALEWLNSPAGD
jgi:hypothetical protein